MITTLILGIPVCVSVFILQRAGFSASKRAILLLLCLTLFSLLAFLFRGRVFLDGADWWQQTPWKQIVMFLLMLSGMFASVLNVAIIRRRAELADQKKQGKNRKVRLRFDRWDMFQPVLFSLVTFSVLHAQIGSGSLNVANVALSFETGFLWQAVVGKQIKEDTISA